MNKILLITLLMQRAIRDCEKGTSPRKLILLTLLNCHHRKKYKFHKSTAKLKLFQFSESSKTEISSANERIRNSDENSSELSTQSLEPSQVIIKRL